MSDTPNSSTEWTDIQPEKITFEKCLSDEAISEIYLVELRGRECAMKIVSCG